MFKFTGAEVEALLTQVSLSQKKDVVRDWYDGYCFGEQRDIYNPWSILKYIQIVQDKPNENPEAWWLNTSSNELVKNFLVKRSVEEVSQRRNDDDSPSSDDMQETFEAVQSKLPLLWAGMSIPVSINKAPNYKTLYDSENNFWTLLYMTGYLTKTFDATKCVDTPNNAQTILTIPNREVREAFAQEIETWFKKVLPKYRSKYYKAFWEADDEQFGKLLSEALLSSMSYYDTQDNDDPKETFYHGTLLGLFIAAGEYEILSNREEGQGRYDLSVADPKNFRAALIEVKKTNAIEELARAVETGGQQSTAQDYEYRLRKKGYRTILYWSIAFCKKQCTAKARLVEKKP